ncbi:MAG: hypothetical protein ACI93R_001444 [Flavobacteriales bacterium]|jgi:uncharacterized protein (TIGR02449 family)
MSDTLLNKIDGQIDQIIHRCDSLEAELANFREREQGWLEERKALIEKNTKARARVESMITHLKSLTSTSEASS